MIATGSHANRGAGASLVIVAAVARNGVIGRDNGLAWNIPEDMAHFKSVTAGAVVIMGRKTWQSIPERFRPLPGRRNIVLSRRGDFDARGAMVLPSLRLAIDSARAEADGAQPVCVIGGAQVYAEAMPLADRLELTEIDRDFPGDARFPDWPREQFAQTARTRLHAAPPNDFDIDFVTYERRAPSVPRPADQPLADR